MYIKIEGRILGQAYIVKINIAVALCRYMVDILGSRTGGMEKLNIGS